MSDCRAMKVHWLLAAALVVLVGLNAPSAASSSSGMAMPAQELPAACDRPSVTDTCCDCCVDCDEMVDVGVCFTFCGSIVSHSRPSATVAVSCDGRSAMPRVAAWGQRAFPPDPDPPKPIDVV